MATCCCTDNYLYFQRAHNPLQTPEKNCMAGWIQLLCSRQAALLPSPTKDGEKDVPDAARCWSQGWPWPLFERTCFWEDASVEGRKDQILETFFHFLQVLITQPEMELIGCLLFFYQPLIKVSCQKMAYAKNKCIKTKQNIGFGQKQPRFAGLWFCSILLHYHFIQYVLWHTDSEI